MQTAYHVEGREVFKFTHKTLCILLDDKQETMYLSCPL